MLFSFVSLAILPSLASAAVYGGSNTHASRHDHSHTSRTSLPDKWFLEDDHPAHALFKRGPTTDGITYATVNTPEWFATFPKYDPPLDPSAVPQAWKDALAKAVAAGKIPNIPQTTVQPNQAPVYPNGLKGDDPKVCSGTYECRTPGTIWDAPSGVIGIGFDDGPQPASDKLNAFLKAQNQPATHYLIGKNILAFPAQFLAAFNNGDDFAVHTWSHQPVTTLSNDMLLAELGWTAQLIHNSTGGRVPRYWRPPYGDSDMRTAAIAKEVFGMTAVHWNQDTDDFNIAAGKQTSAAVAKLFDGWLAGAKNPGLIILEHETSDQSVQAFMDAYPKFKAQGWKPISQARMFANPYQNGNLITDAVTSQNIVAGAGSSGTTSTNSTSPSRSSASVSGTNTGTRTSPSASPSHSGAASPSGYSGSAFGMATLIISTVLVAFL